MQGLIPAVPFVIGFVGMTGVFGESGKPEEVMKKYGMNKEAIVKAVRELI